MESQSIQGSQIPQTDPAYPKVRIFINGEAVETFYRGPIFIQGNLRKKTSNDSVFNSNKYQTRYFTLDLQTATFKYGKSESSQDTVYSYNDILEVQLVQTEGRKDHPPFLFTVKCRDREQVLASKSIEERTTWVNGFQVIFQYKQQIASRSEVSDSYQQSLQNGDNLQQDEEQRKRSKSRTKIGQKLVKAFKLKTALNLASTPQTFMVQATVNLLTSKKDSKGQEKQEVNPPQIQSQLQNVLSRQLKENENTNQADQSNISMQQQALNQQAQELMSLRDQILRYYEELEKQRLDFSKQKQLFEEEKAWFQLEKKEFEKAKAGFNVPNVAMAPIDTRQTSALSNMPEQEVQPITRSLAQSQSQSDYFGGRRKQSIKLRNKVNRQQSDICDYDDEQKQSAMSNQLQSLQPSKEGTQAATEDASKPKDQEKIHNHQQQEAMVAANPSAFQHPRKSMNTLFEHRDNSSINIAQPTILPSSQAYGKIDTNVKTFDIEEYQEPYSSKSQSIRSNSMGSFLQPSAQTLQNQQKRGNETVSTNVVEQAQSQLNNTKKKLIETVVADENEVEDNNLNNISKENSDPFYAYANNKEDKRSMIGYQQPMLKKHQSQATFNAKGSHASRLSNKNIQVLQGITAQYPQQDLNSIEQIIQKQREANFIERLDKQRKTSTHDQASSFDHSKGYLHHQKSQIYQQQKQSLHQQQTNQDKDYINIFNISPTKDNQHQVKIPSLSQDIRQMQHHNHSNAFDQQKQTHNLTQDDQMRKEEQKQAFDYNWDEDSMVDINQHKGRNSNSHKKASQLKSSKSMRMPQKKNQEEFEEIWD